MNYHRTAPVSQISIFTEERKCSVWRGSIIFVATRYMNINMLDSIKIFSFASHSFFWVFVDILTTVKLNKVQPSLGFTDHQLWKLNFPFSPSPHSSHSLHVFAETLLNKMFDKRHFGKQCGKENCQSDTAQWKLWKIFLSFFIQICRMLTGSFKI